MTPAQTRKVPVDADMNADMNAEMDADMDAGVAALRSLLLVAEQFRLRTAEHFHLGVSDTRALTFLSAAGGSLTPAELARALGFTSSSLTALLDRLARVGLTSRSAHPDDRRKTVVAITEPGVALLAQIDDWMGGALAGFDAVRLGVVTEALGRITASLQTQTDDLFRLGRLQSDR